jgi:hypothetical protein
MTLWFERKKEGKKTKIWKPTDAWVTIKTVETTKVVVVVAAAFFFHGAVLLFSLCFSLKLRAADFVFRLKIEARRRARSLTVCTKKSRAGEQALNVLPGRQTAARMEGMNTQLHSSKRVCVWALLLPSPIVCVHNRKLMHSCTGFTQPLHCFRCTHLCFDITASLLIDDQLWQWNIRFEPIRLKLWGFDALDWFV